MAWPIACPAITVKKGFLITENIKIDINRAQEGGHLHICGVGLATLALMAGTALQNRKGEYY